MREGLLREPPKVASFKKSLSQLQRLSAQSLHETSARIRSDLSGAEWKMALCLQASVRENRFRQLGYANITQYAEEALGMSGKKAGSLLAIARLLEHLPLCAAAFRNNEIDWCKLRALQSVLTPETEGQWLEYAKRHRTNEVEKKVAMAPSDWKRRGGMDASIAGNPIATVDAVADIIEGTADAEVPVSGQARTETGQIEDAASDGPFFGSEQSGPASQETDDEVDSGVSPLSYGHGKVVAESPDARNSNAGQRSADVAEVDGGATHSSMASLPLPAAPRLIRLVVDLTPDQFALYECAESRIRGQTGKKVPRAEVVARMAEMALNGGTARSRSKYQILVHTDSAMETGWYDTERGPLPVSPEILGKVKTTKTLPLAPRLGQESKLERPGMASQKCSVGQAEMPQSARERVAHSSGLMIVFGRREADARALNLRRIAPRADTRAVITTRAASH